VKILHQEAIMIQEKDETIVLLLLQSSLPCPSLLQKGDVTRCIRHLH